MNIFRYVKTYRTSERVGCMILYLLPVCSSVNLGTACFSTVMCCTEVTKITATTGVGLFWWHTTVRTTTQ